MDQYGLAFLVLAALYIVIDITKYMANLCVRRNNLRDIAATLNELNKKFQEMPFEAVCLCEVCAPPAPPIPHAASRRPSVAAVLAAATHYQPSEKIEHIAIGILESDDDNDN